ncbi:flagellar export protein FliJ [Bacillus suaedaesalsae]|uniref:Flagellar FliJ protein n=1 Tax=Bacillus suaedaesalsae TaxID=2810349 RepID=A0ABS2DIX5_9BACI|nr:flagellar export protein FliJ [Bacillus suaedaesalsae]MBM6618444.1 flagellar biosynthesis chaperone FliJ [Bacillus suaedaesalsae]
MSFKYKFQKILSIKETEKQRALEAYQLTVKQFEEVAEKLYHYLKQKEDLESIQLQKLSVGLNVTEIKHHQTFITNLEKTISHFQNLVASARQNMLGQEAQLLEKNIEVKKYEKLKDKQQEDFQELVSAADNRLMDEISIQQYMNKES